MAVAAAPYRDFTADQEQRIRDSQWPSDGQDVFRRELELMRQEGITEARIVLHAWRICEVGFASLPGELFVEWGMRIKAESPFPWTYPVELSGDYLGYLVTQQAWEAGEANRSSLLAGGGDHGGGGAGAASASVGRGRTHSALSRTAAGSAPPASDAARRDVAPPRQLAAVKPSGATKGAESSQNLQQAGVSAGAGLRQGGDRDARTLAEAVE